MKMNRQLLIEKVSDARESCCGSSVKTKSILIAKIRSALNLAIISEVDAKTLAKLEMALKYVKISKGYYDRLDADHILSDILNQDLKEEVSNHD